VRACSVDVRAKAATGAGHRRGTPLSFPRTIYILGAFLIAWSASISWVYTTPLVGFAPLGMAAWFIVQPFGPCQRTLSWSAGALALALCAASIIIAAWTDQTLDLADVYPRFGHVLTNQSRYRQFVALKATLDIVLARSRGPVVIIPGEPIVYFLHDLRNPTPVDWWLPSEYLGGAQKVKEAFTAKRPVVILARDPQGGLEAGIETELTTWIVEQYRTVERIGTYDVLWP